MEILTEITNTIIGMCLIFQLLLFAHWLSRNEDYQKLAVATENLKGTISYNLNRTLRKLWSTFYQYQDKLMGYKTLPINYFS
jgi:hypothetical protein